MKRRVRVATAVLAVTQIIGWGTTFYLPAIFGAELGRDLGLSGEAVFAGVTIMVIMTGLLGPAYGRALDRHGAPHFMAAGSAVTALGLLGLSLARGPISYFAAWLALGVGGALTLGMPAFVALAQVAGGRARSTLIVLMMFSGLSSSIFWPIMGLLQPFLDWRGICMAFAGLHLVVSLPFHLVLLPRRAAPGSAAAGEIPPPAPPAIAPGAQRATFVWMALAFALSGFVSWGLSLHMVAILEGTGLPAALSLTLGSSIGALQVVARVADIALAKRLAPDRMALIASIVLPASFVLIFAGFGAPAAALGFVALYSLSTGHLAVARATLPLHVFGAASYGTFAGRLAFIQNIAFALAPMVLAAVVDRGGVTAALALDFACSVLALAFFALVSLQLRRHPAPAQVVTERA